MDENVDDYEVPDRLMGKKDVNDITSILGLDSSSLNNYEPLPEPPKYGAGKVNPFASDKRSKFIKPEEFQPGPSDFKGESRAEYVPTPSMGEKVPRLDVHNIISNLLVSRYKFIPPFLDLYHKVGNQPRDIAGKYLYEFPETAYGFEVPKEEVRKRAAWAWYRTHLLCQQAAENLEDGGPAQIHLGLGALRSNASTEWRNAITKHRSKAARAKAQALRLYPKLLQEGGVQSPTWQKAWTPEDTQYYEEMVDNHDRVQRFKMAAQCNSRAVEFVFEAISVYLEWKQENPVEGKTAPFLRQTVKYAAGPSGGGMFNTSYFGGAGGLSKIWSEAAKWSFDPAITPFYALRFRWWWLRAAMATGHAEWLTMELDDRNPSYPAKTMNDLKLLPPAPIGCYVNDCVIMAHLAVFHGSFEWPFYVDDKWQTTYTEFQMESREYAWTLHGERNYNFAPGAPDFVFLKKAKKGWVQPLQGMFPMGTSILAIETGYFDRYYRYGLAHYMPKSASRYERALAVCVDDVVLSFDQNRYIDILTLPNDLGSNILADLEIEMSSLANARQYLTAVEAERYGFERRVNRRLEHHLGRVGELFETAGLKSLEESAKLIYLMRIQKVVGQMLGPWFNLTVWSSLAEGDAPWHIISAPESHDKITLPNGIVEKVFYSAMTQDMIRYWMLRRIFNCVEKCRSSLVSGQFLDEEEWHFITPFRAYLETGSVERLPLVSSGLEQARETTVSEWRRTRIYRCDGNCGCQFDRMEAPALATYRAREASIGPARIERDRIKQAFLSQERKTQSKAQPSPPTGPGDLQRQLFFQILAAANKHDDGQLFQDMLTTEGRETVRANERGSTSGQNQFYAAPAANNQAKGKGKAPAANVRGVEAVPVANGRSVFSDPVNKPKPIFSSKPSVARRPGEVETHLLPTGYFAASSASSNKRAPIVNSKPSAALPSGPIAPPMTKKKKRGFFSRIFGRRDRKEV